MRSTRLNVARPISWSSGYLRSSPTFWPNLVDFVLAHPLVDDQRQQKNNHERDQHEYAHRDCDCHPSNPGRLRKGCSRAHLGDPPTGLGIETAGAPATELLVGWIVGATRRTGGHLLPQTCNLSIVLRLLEWSRTTE